MDKLPAFYFNRERPILHLAHANGYPPACYRRMMAPFLTDYDVSAVYLRPWWPNANPNDITDLHALADDMIHFFDQEKYHQVIGVGHSLGAILTLYAALKRPELFRAIILIEPVFLLPSILAAFPDPKLDMVDDANMARMAMLTKVANSRRQSWASYEEAFNHFRPKAVYSRWPDDLLWDYVHYALGEDTEGRIQLASDPSWEARIYSLPPRDVWQVLSLIPQPTLAIRGQLSESLVPAAWHMWQMSQPGATFVEIPNCGHLLPMERPLVAAEAIKTFLKSVK